MTNNQNLFASLSFFGVAFGFCFVLVRFSATISTDLTLASFALAGASAFVAMKLLNKMN